jgi:hypothetical protein
MNGMEEDWPLAGSFDAAGMLPGGSDIDLGLLVCAPQ